MGVGLSGGDLIVMLYNCSHYKATLKISQIKGLRGPKCGLPLSPLAILKRE